MKNEQKPPQWYQFDIFVLLGAAVGLGVSVGIYSLLRFVVFAGADLSGALSHSDVISATATALSGLTIGGVAVMQYRRHKWAEYQSKLDADAKTGERLSKAIEHLGSKAEHVRIGAIYELKRLAEDSPRDRKNVSHILSNFVREEIGKLSLRARDTTVMPKPEGSVPLACWFLSHIYRHYGIIPHYDHLAARFLDLQHMDFVSARLHNAVFDGSNLCGTDFRQADFNERTSFTGAIIDDKTIFSPGVRLRFFEAEEPDHTGDPRLQY